MMMVMKKQIGSQTVKLTSNKNDVFSFALLAYEVLFQQRPWGKEDGDPVERTIQGRRPKPNDDKKRFYTKVDAEKYFVLWNEVIQPAWNQDPNCRPSFARIAEQLFIQ